MAYSADFRNKVVQLYNSGTSTADLCAQFHISRSILYQWRKKQKFQTFLNAILQRFNAMLQPWKMKIPSIKNLLLLLICP